MKNQTYASVWNALKQSPEAAASIRLRADLMGAVTRHVTASGLSQPRFNGLLRGRIAKSSLDALVIMLGRPGEQVRPKVHKVV